MSLLLQQCQSQERFKYGYSSVWEGNFTSCIFSVGECMRPLEGSDCTLVTCQGAIVVCPPSCKLLTVLLTNLGTLLAQLQCVEVSFTAYYLASMEGEGCTS